MKPAVLSVLVLSLACGGAVADPTNDVVLAEPATIVGGVIDPLPTLDGRKAEFPVAGQSIELSDGAAVYRVMFGRTPDGASIVERINDEASATITASIDAEGRLVLTTVEAGPAAELHIVDGYAVPALGLELGQSAYGR